MVGCSVPGCSSRSGRDATKFFPIPALRENVPIASKERYRRRRALWLSKLGKSGLLFENTHMMVCSLHFVSGKPSSPLDVDNCDWVPHLRMPRVSQLESDPSFHEEPVGGREPDSTLQSDFHEEPVGGREPDSTLQSDCVQQQDHTTQHSYRDITIHGEDPSSLFNKSCEKDCHGLANSTFCEDVASASHSVLPLSDVSMDQDFSVDLNVNIDESLTDNDVGLDNVEQDFSVVDQDVNIDEPVTRYDVGLNNVQLEYSQLLKSYAKLRDQLTEAEVDKFETSKSMSDLEDKCKRYEQKSEMFETTTTEFQDRLQAHEDRIRVLEEQLGVANKKVTDLNEEVEKLKRCSITLERLQSDEEFLQFNTGLSKYKVFDIVLTYVTNYVTDTTCSLKPWQCLLLTLMRLRLSLTLQDLAYRFGISKTTACRIFEKWLYWLYIYLSPFINWTDRETLRATMPNSFKEEFGNSVAVIIDCFELFTERPGALDSRAMTWSNYKHHNTVKYLIGITPLGAVSFISEGWGGRVSDKHITANSGLYDKLLPGDVVMADRGFLIGEDLGFLCAKLLIPAFTRGQPQLSSHDISDTRKIASLRVHVERVIGLVKNKYRIMKSVLPSEFLHKKPGHKVPEIDEIVHVCCALTNLTPGIV